MKVVEFSGGLGDIFIDIFKFNSYTLLDQLEPDEKVKIVLLSANPGVRDLFTWHPKAKQFEILDLRSITPWGAYERHRIGIEDPVPKEPRNGAPVRFYVSEEDKKIFTEIEIPYLVFSISAGISSVNIPLPIAEEAADIAIRRGFQVVVVGKNYYSVLKNLRKGKEETLPRGEQRLSAREGIVDTIDRLSVPGLAMLVSEAAGVFCCHSSLKHVSWQFRRPVFVLWHEVKRKEWEEKLGTTWGRDFPETCSVCLSDWNPSRWADFLDKFCK